MAFAILLGLGLDWLRRYLITQEGLLPSGLMNYYLIGSGGRGKARSHRVNSTSMTYFAWAFGSRFATVSPDPLHSEHGVPSTSPLPAQCAQGIPIFTQYTGGTCVTSFAMTFLSPHQH